MDLGALIAEFRIQSQDYVRPYLWSDEELAAWFSEAETEAAIRARLIRVADELSIATGDTVVDLPVGMFDVQYAELRSADGVTREIKAIDHDGLSAIRPGWRTRIDRPQEFIHNENGTLTLGSIADGAYLLYVEGYKTPASVMAGDGDTPEVSGEHHIKLLEWVFYRAYSKPDAETMNPGRSAEGEERFTRYFGKRLNADLRRRQNANRPHRNRIQL